MTRPEPLLGEKLVMKLKPHPMAFWHLFAVSGILIMLGYLVKQLYAFVVDIRLRSPIPFLQQYNVANVLILWAVLIGSAIVIGLVYIRVTSVLLFGSIALIGTVLTEYFKMPLEVHFWLLVVCGFVGFVMTEFYRRGHTYYVTTFRLITERSFVSYDSRQLTYDKINDLALVQGLFGRLLNYGTVIPVTASGLGLGEDLASAEIGSGVGTGGRALSPIGFGLALSASGGRAVQIPRGRTYHTLYGVSHPREVQTTIARMIQGQTPGPYLKRIASGIESLIEKNKTSRNE